MNSPKQKTEIFCTSCPLGCQLEVTVCCDEIQVTGHDCKLGIAYAKEEMTNPTRNIATSVAVTDGDCPRLSVKTAKPIPKAAIKDVVAAIHKITAHAPVAIGDVVLTNASDTGVDILATRHISYKKGE